MADKNIGQRLKEAREQKGLTQAEVCEKLGIPKVQNLSAYESGGNNPPMDTIFKQLLRLYDVSADWVIFGDKRQNTADKSPYDIISQFVESVDYLGLKLTYSKDDYGKKYLDINLLTSKYEEIEPFAMAWYNYRNLLDNGMLDREDYELLMSKKIPKQLQLCAYGTQTWNGINDDDQLPF